MDNVSLKIWQVMQPMVRKEITKQIQACMKCKVMTVTTAYNSQTQTVGVREPFSNEVFLPVYGGVDATKLVKGAVAWVVAMHGSWSNAMVFMLGDGSGTSGLSVDDKTEIEQAATQAVLQALPEWVRSEEKPTYTAQEVGAVPITGGRMTGSLNLGATDSQNSVLLTQHRLGTDGQTKWQLQLLIDDGNTGNVAFFQNGQLANRIRFFTDKTTLGQPLDIGSGGFGGTTAAEARANLGITPQNIEAVPLAGGTMTGNLTVGNGTEGNAPMLLLRRLMSDGTTNGNARLYMTASGNLKIDLFRDDTRVNSWTLAPDTVTEIPTKLPSPGTLTFTGAATGTYDGSVNTTVNIPVIAGTGLKRINSNIRKFTTALWQQYGAINHSEGWTYDTETYDNSHINVGDTAYIVGEVTDAFDINGEPIDAAIYGVVTSLETGRVMMTTSNLLMGSVGATPATQTIVDAVLAALPTWSGGSY